MHARSLTAAFALLSALSGAVAVVPTLRAPAAVAREGEPATPVFSARRAAPALAATVARARLAAGLEGALGQPVLAGSRPRTCLVVRGPDGDLLYSEGTDAALIPASAMKVLTASAVLHRIGPDDVYVTPVRAAAVSSDGTVGDLWLVGSGDPLLATADFAAIAGWLETPRPATSLEALADRVFNAGVRRVARVLGDESRYDSQRYVATWEPHYATNPEVGPQSALNLNGGFAQWRPRAVPAPAPAAHAAAVLADLLRARGITVGATGEGRAPAGLPAVAQIESPPMSEAVAVMLRDSDNLVSELLVKELGARFGGGGTTAAGTEVVRRTAADLGLPTDSLRNADGSGLDRGNRMTCGLLMDLLALHGPSGPLADGLPVAGSTGTLTRRFLGTAAAGRVRAKTGSLSGVVALSGYATGNGGQTITFSLVANNLPFDGAGTALQGQVADVLTAFPDAPPLESIGPEPPRALAPASP